MPRDLVCRSPMATVFNNYGSVIPSTRLYKCLDIKGVLRSLMLHDQISFVIIKCKLHEYNDTYVYLTSNFAPTSCSLKVYNLSQLQ